MTKQLIYKDITKVLYMMGNHVGVDGKPLRFEYQDDAGKWVGFLIQCVLCDYETFTSIETRVHPDDVPVFEPKDGDYGFMRKPEESKNTSNLQPYGDHSVTRNHGFATIKRAGKEWLPPCEIREE